MITIGSGSSRPASSIPAPGISHATASTAGACVIAANTQPGSHHKRCASRAPRTAAAEQSASSPPAAARATLARCRRSGS